MKNLGYDSQELAIVYHVCVESPERTGPTVWSLTGFVHERRATLPCNTEESTATVGTGLGRATPTRYVETCPPTFYMSFANLTQMGPSIDVHVNVRPLLPQVCLNKETGRRFIVQGVIRYWKYAKPFKTMGIARGLHTLTGAAPSHRKIRPDPGDQKLCANLPNSDYSYSIHSTSTCISRAPVRRLSFVLATVVLGDWEGYDRRRAGQQPRPRVPSGQASLLALEARSMCGRDQT